MQQNLLKLQLGRVDMVLEDKRIVDYNIEHGPKELSGLVALNCPATPLLTLPLHFGMNRDYPNADLIMAAFNVQLKEMNKDGTLDAILKKLGARGTEIASRR